MWTPIAFLVILAAAASAEHVSGFKVGSEYKYHVSSKTLTSLHQVSHQYSGVLIRAQLTVTPVKEDELIAYISQPEKATIHTTLPEGVETHISPDVVKYTPFTLSQEPFVIKLKDGVVDEVVVSKDIPIWEVNIIRSIVSQFQLDTHGKRIIPSKLNTIPQGEETTAAYKIMEDTIEGDCEVLYDISPLPKYILQRMPYLVPQLHLVEKDELIDIMKTRNFSNCEQRPGYHFGLTGLTDWEPTTNKMGNFLSRSSVSRVIVSGNLKSYTIQSSVTTNKLVLSPEVYNNQKGEVVSRVNVTLVSIQSGSQTTQGPKNPQVLKKLVYDFNSPFTSDIQAREKWDKRQEKTIFKPTGTTVNTLFQEETEGRRSIDDRTLILSNEGWYQEMPKMTQAPETPFLPYFVGHMGHSIQHSKEVNINQVVRKLVEQIGQTLQDQTQITKVNTLEKFSMLTRIIRTMNVKQLEQTVQEVYVPEEETTQEVSNTGRNGWMVFRDALAQAGTGPALTTIVNLITTQKIKGEEAAQVVSTLSDTVRYPTTEYLTTFFELVKKPEVVSQKGLNVSCIYTFTKLVRLAQVNLKTMHNRYPVHTFGYLTGQDDMKVTQEYIPYFAQQLEKSVEEGDSHKIQVYIRALGNIAHPKIVQVFEPYLEGKRPMTDFQRTLVVVSLNKLAMVHPRLTRSILYKIYANTGEVYQVRVAAVYGLMKTNPPASMLQRMAQFTHEDPSNQVRSVVKSAIESAALLVSEGNRELRRNAQSAVNLVVPKVFGIQYSRSNLTDYLVKGLHLDYTQTFDYIGSEDSLIPKAIFYGVVGNQNGYKNTIAKVYGMVSSIQYLTDLLEDVFVTGEYEETVEETGTNDQIFTVEKINKILNVEHELKEQVEGNFGFKWGTMQRFFTFDNHTIESLPYIINRLTQSMAKGKVYNYQKIFNKYEITIGLPTVTGLPFTYTLETPTYAGVKGKVQVDIPETKTGPRGAQLPRTAQMSANIEFTYTTARQGEIGFVTPFDHKRYVAGYKRQLQVNVPVKGSVSLDVEKRHLQMEIKPVDKRGDYQLLHYITKPFTAVQDIFEFKPITESTDTKVMRTNFLKEVKEQYGEKFLGLVVRLTGQTEKRNFDLKKIVYDIIERHDITSGLLYPTAEGIVDYTDVELYYDPKMSKTQTISLTATYRKIESKETQGGVETGKVFVPTGGDSNTRAEEFYKRASSGIKGSTVYVADVGVKVQGGTPIQYVGTVAYARSPVDAPTRVLAYLHKTIGTEKQEMCFDGTVRDSYVSGVDFEKVVQTEPRSEVEGHLKFGENCESGSEVTLTGKLERSQERREYLEKLPQVQKCKTEMKEGNKLLANCRNATWQAGLMDKYTFTVKYHGVPETVKNMTYQVYSVLRHIGYPYVTESIATHVGDSQNGNIELDVSFSPDLKTASVYISTPTGIAQFRDVRVPKYARTIFVIHPVYGLFQRLGWSSLRQQYDAYCTIDTVQTKTFDNQTYPTHIGNVWHVMSMSVPRVNTHGKYDHTHDFSVLVREDSSNQKEIQFVIGCPKSTVVRVTPTQGQTTGSVSINGQEVHFDEKGFYEYRNQVGKTLIQTYVLPTGELKIVAPENGIEFLYDKTRVQFVLSQEYKNRVGGLCGLYNGERFDYVTPKGYILQNPEEFVATWALTSEGRIGELKKKAQEHSLYKKTVVLTNVVSGQDTGRADTFGRVHESGLSMDYDLTNSYGSEETHGNKCTTKRIMVIEREGKHCFSIQPQTACKAGCQVEKTRPMSADFICVNKTQTSSHWAQMVARGAQPNFKNKGNAQKMQFEGPEVCTEA